jgi:hypothetical protein
MRDMLIINRMEALLEDTLDVVVSIRTPPAPASKDEYSAKKKRHKEYK